jgi:hypothetical protein
MIPCGACLFTRGVHYGRDSALDQAGGALQRSVLPPFRIANSATEKQRAKSCW